jgi:acetyl-CoA carboxylase biotin carboxyl carrier protein
MPLTDDDVREILRIIDESPLEELRIEANGLSLYVSKRPASDTVAFHDPGPAAPVPLTAATPAPVSPAAAAGQEKTEGVARDDGTVTIDAPLLGTFYRAEGPGQKPFVDVGSVVEPGTVVAIIEVMKMMNSVTAGISGTIVAIIPGSGQLVEFGQPLFQVRPE